MGRRVRLPEVHGELIPRCEGARAEDIIFTAELNTAELNAVLSGSKPAFLEPIPGYVRALAHDLPPGCAYAQAPNGADCIYNAAAIAEEFGFLPGTDVHAFVVQKLQNEKFGRILGYGMETITEKPNFGVTVLRNGIPFSAFHTVPTESQARRYAEARTCDFRREYPQDHWRYVLTYRP